MGVFDPDVCLNSLYADGKRLCFYPSCGNDLLWAVMQLDADMFIFSDYAPRSPEARKRFWHEVAADFRENAQPLALVASTVGTRVFQSGAKWGFLFFQDNNDALTRIVESDWSVDVFVGIRDGCAEGGNYECVHGAPFLTKMLAAAAGPLTYYADHSYLLTDPDESYRRRHTYFRPRVLYESRWEFALRCVLVVPDRVERGRHAWGTFSGAATDGIRREDLEVFFPSRGQGAPSLSIRGRDAGASDSELMKLSEFRTRHHEGVLAQYDVRQLADAARLPPV